MRLILAVLFLATLAGCDSCGTSSDPYVKVRFPLAIGSEPRVEPTGYGIRERVTTRLVEAPTIREYQYAPAPAARAVGPCGDGGQPYSPPPVPGDVPESIPAFRSR